MNMCENFTEIPCILSERNATRLAEKQKKEWTMNEKGKNLETKRNGSTNEKNNNNSSQRKNLVAMYFVFFFLPIRIVKLTGWRLLLHDCHRYKLRSIINLTSLH